MEKYCRTREATEDNIALHMRIAWWIAKATNTHSEYVIFLDYSKGSMVTGHRVNTREIQ